jgi:hypothetical protein
MPTLMNESLPGLLENNELTRNNIMFEDTMTLEDNMMLENEMINEDDMMFDDNMMPSDRMMQDDMMSDEDMIPGEDMIQEDMMQEDMMPEDMMQEDMMPEGMRPGTMRPRTMRPDYVRPDDMMQEEERPINNQMPRNRQMPRDNQMPTRSPRPSTMRIPRDTSRIPSASDDSAYLTRMYPTDIRHILTEVKRELDNIDYEGSFIYDVYPDKTTLICISKIIYSNLLSTTSQNELKDDYECRTDEKYLSNNRSDMFPPANSNLWMFYVVTLLVFDDIFDRRQRKNF